MAAANLGNFERFKKPNPPTPSIASSEDLVDLRRKDLMAKPLSAEDVRHHRVFDAKTEAELRRKRAEREMWLDEACRNFVHGVVDAASGTSFAHAAGPGKQSSYSFPSRSSQRRSLRCQRQQHFVVVGRVGEPRWQFNRLILGQVFGSIFGLIFVPLIGIPSNRECYSIGRPG